MANESQTDSGKSPDEGSYYSLNDATEEAENVRDLDMGADTEVKDEAPNNDLIFTKSAFWHINQE